MIIKRALLIGINYIGSNAKLNGCINDSLNLKNFLIENKFYRKKDIILMNDKMKRKCYPSKKNILRFFSVLINFAKKRLEHEIHFFISYSGHGTYLTDRNGDEIDRRDEALVPIDYQKSGIITDDYIKEHFINKLPSNVKLFMLIDGCHSGTMCDLKYNYNIDAKNTFRTSKNNETKCKCVMISGCKDSEYSYDAYLKDRNSGKYKPVGAMTTSLLYNFNKKISYHELIIKMRRFLNQNNFHQTPQLSSGNNINTRSTLLFV